MLIHGNVIAYGFGQLNIHYSLQYGVLYFRGRLCVPNVPEFKAIILEEADLNKYTVHPSSTKMYQNLK